MLGLRLGVNDLYLRDISKKVKSSFRVKQEKENTSDHFLAMVI